LHYPLLHPVHICTIYSSNRPRLHYPLLQPVHICTLLLQPVPICTLLLQPVHICIIHSSILSTSALSHSPIVHISTALTYLYL
jgi:hypothetical protein